MMSFLVKRPVCLAFVLLGCCTRLAAQVTLTADHCVPAWNKSGTLSFEIDSTYKKEPYFVRLDGPNGMLDSIAEFRGISRSYEGLPAGEYCILVKCCSTCTAEVSVDLMSYDLMLAGDVTVLWTKEKALPEIDSSAILLACTVMETEEEALCQVVFSLYAAIDIPSEQLQLMLINAVQRLKRIKLEGYPENEEYNYDAWSWISDPFKVLFRFDETGQIVWVYSE